MPDGRRAWSSAVGVCKHLYPAGRRSSRIITCVATRMPPRVLVATASGATAGLAATSRLHALADSTQWIFIATLALAAGFAAWFSPSVPDEWFSKKITRISM
jgi:hypothetical protein